MGGYFRWQLRFTVIVGMLIALLASPASSSAAPSFPFHQCPQVGQSPSCAILIVINANRSVTVLGDPSVSPFDGSDDTLVGIQNDSALPVQAITVTGPGSGLSLFDGDGLCQFILGIDLQVPCPQPHPTSYEGPVTSFVVDPSLPDSVEVDFTGSISGSLDAGKATFFSLEGALTSAILTAREGGLVKFKIQPKFGDSFNGVVARLQPSGGAGNLSQENATIGWGDGSITQATLSIPAGTTTELDVAGTHTYWSVGQLPGLPMVIRLTNAYTGDTQTFSGQAVVQSRYVGMGDSYSSGEGAHWSQIAGCNWTLYQDPSGNPSNTDHLNGDSVNQNGQCAGGLPFQPVAGNDTCHRATTAYPHVLVNALASKIPGLTLNFVACSGDVVKDAYVARVDNQHQGEKAQAVALAHDVSLVTMTFGGNDLNFADVVSRCVNPLNDAFDCIAPEDPGVGLVGSDSANELQTMGYSTVGTSDGQPLFRSDASVQPLPQLGAANPSQLPVLLAVSALKSKDLNLHDKLVMLLRVVKELSPGARILLQGYPRWFGVGGTGASNEHYGTNSFEGAWLNDRIKVFDATIHDAAIESGVAQYVDVYDAFNGHELNGTTPVWPIDSSGAAVCQGAGSYMNGVTLLQGFAGSPELMHPNPCGHQAEGQIVTQSYLNPPVADDTFSISRGATNITSVGVGPVVRVTFTARWDSGALKTVLSGPSGQEYTPSLSGASDTNFATWTVDNSPPGVWRLTETNLNTTDTGTINGKVSVGYPAYLVLPPAATITSKLTPHFLGCSATFTAQVSSGVGNPHVASYTWFDDQGNQIGTGASVTEDSLRCQFFIIVRTNGSNGQSRYTRYSQIYHRSSK